MKKLTTAILSLATLAVLSAGATFVCDFSQNEAQAEARTNVTQEGVTLVTPTSYEQYLPLSAPNSVAFSQSGTAIADGNLIYFYDGQSGTYRKYEHTANADQTKNVVTSLQFAENGLLYFLDASTFLYSVHPTTLAVEKTSLVCSSFTIYRNEIFFINVSANSQFSKTTLDNLDVSKAELLVPNLGSKPVVAEYDGILYYTDDGKYLHQIQHSSGVVTTPLVKYFSSEIYSMAFTDKAFAYTDVDGNFFVYDRLDILGGDANADGFTPLYTAQGGYTNLTAKDGDLFVVKGASVKRFNVSETAFSDYEICSSSLSVNRLSGATETTLTGDLLLTADDGNNRISVYDVTKKTYADPVSYPLDEVSYLCSDGETVLVANGQTALLYSLQSKTYGELLATFTDFKGNLVGAASVYGAYYFVTEGNRFYKAQNTEDGWTASYVSKKTSQTTKLLTSDVYGNLYVACGTDVYRFTETEFTDLSSSGAKICSIPAATTKLLVDYEQAVYALSGNTMYQYGETERSFALGKSLVYSQDESTPVTSVAFSVENNQAFLLYDGNLLVKTNEFSLPTVKTIAVDGADESIFAEESATFTVVKTQKNALAVRFDVHTLKGATVFPYLSYGRETTELTALKIGEAGDYSVLALLTETHEYDTLLVKTDFCEELPSDDYRTAYAEADRKTGYLSNAVTLYKFPYLTDLLSVTRLEKGGTVTLLGEIGELDYEYYHVSVESTDGETQTGYIPKSYVNLFDGTPEQSEVSVVGDEADGDELWRLAYLVLGFGVVCILADYLLLRKKKDC